MYVIRDSIHGDIKFDDNVFVELINTPEFQRLRRIAQLGGAQFAYPSATHTRFSHSIGVYYMVCEFLKNPIFQKKLNENDKKLVKIAGLLHDIGHGPFSHSFEKISHKEHEEYSREIITNPNGKIASILLKDGINPQDIAKIIEGTYHNNVVNLLVSSQLDADRLDYLNRDSYYAGVNYASLDTSWLINNAEIREQKVCFSIKAVYAVESYLLGRYHMFKQVYNHKISLTFDVMLSMWFKRLKDLKDMNFNFKNPRFVLLFKNLLDGRDLLLGEYLKLDDFTMMDLFKTAMDEDDEIFADLARRIVNRDFFTFSYVDEVDVEKIKKDLVFHGYDLNYYACEDYTRNTYVYYETNEHHKDEKIYFFGKKNAQLSSLFEVSELSKSIQEINEKKTKKIFLFPKY